MPIKVPAKISWKMLWNRIGFHRLRLWTITSLIFPLWLIVIHSEKGKKIDETMLVLTLFTFQIWSTIWYNFMGFFGISVGCFWDILFEYFWDLFWNFLGYFWNFWTLFGICLRFLFRIFLRFFKGFFGDFFVVFWNIFGNLFAIFV